MTTQEGVGMERPRGQKSWGANLDTATPQAQLTTPPDVRQEETSEREKKSEIHGS